jgi:cell wall-associated NlpC family hydrolase
MVAALGITCFGRVGQAAKPTPKAQLQSGKKTAATPVAVSRPGRKISNTSKAAKPSTSKNKIEEILRTALAYRGVRYRYGGMSSRGFDCSGFVAKVLLSQNLDLPHNAAALFNRGKKVERGNLRPGDLVFFRTRSKHLRISHVGIYLGEGKFIHASSGKGSVRVDTLLTGYYARRYAGARRVVFEQNSASKK